MSLESATYINQLVETNPAASDAISTADDHLRLIKAAIKATFPNITGPVTQSQAGLNTPFPPGGIIMWSGAQSAIPAGWFLCNGANGTPDLRGRFVVGAGGSYGVGNTGGSATKTLSASNIPSHSHSASSTSTFYGNPIGSHSHSVSDPGHAHTHVVSNGQASYSASQSVGTINGGNAASTSTSTTGISIGSTSIGAPTGTVSTSTSIGATGSGDAFDVMNPYYALCYIMKG